MAQWLSNFTLTPRVSGSYPAESNTSYGASLCRKKLQCHICKLLSNIFYHINFLRPGESQQPEFSLWLRLWESADWVPVPDGEQAQAGGTNLVVFYFKGSVSRDFPLQAFLFIKLRFLVLLVATKSGVICFKFYGDIPSQNWLHTSLKRLSYENLQGSKIIQKLFSYIGDTHINNYKCHCAVNVAG